MADRTEPVSTVSRIARGCTAAAVSFATLGMANVSETFRNKYWTTAIDGRVEKEVFTEGCDPLDAERGENAHDSTSGAKNRLVERLGYDPKDRASIQAYLKRPEVRSELFVASGHYCLIDSRREGTSCFLFVPGGDWSKACSIRLCKASTGEELKGRELHRAVSTYASQFEDMKKGQEKVVEKIALGMCKDKNLSDEEIKKQKPIFKKAVDPKFTTAIIDFKAGHTKLFHEIGQNNRPMFRSWFQGAMISWGNNTVKDVAQIHKGAPDNKLSANKPFANSPPPQFPFNFPPPRTQPGDSGDRSNPLDNDDDDDDDDTGVGNQRPSSPFAAEMESSHETRADVHPTPHIQEIAEE